MIVVAYSNEPGPERQTWRRLGELHIFEACAALHVSELAGAMWDAAGVAVLEDEDKPSLYGPCVTGMNGDHWLPPRMYGGHLKHERSREPIHWLCRWVSRRWECSLVLNNRQAWHLTAAEIELLEPDERLWYERRAKLHRRRGY